MDLVVSSFNEDGTFTVAHTSPAGKTWMWTRLGYGAISANIHATHLVDFCNAALKEGIETKFQFGACAPVKMVDC